MNVSKWLFLPLLIPGGVIADSKSSTAPLLKANWQTNQSKTLCLMQQEVADSGVIGFQHHSGEALHFFFQPAIPYFNIDKASFYLDVPFWRQERVYHQDFPVYFEDNRMFSQDDAAEVALNGLREGFSPVFHYLAGGHTQRVAALPVNFAKQYPKFVKCRQQLLPYNKEQLQGDLFFKQGSSRLSINALQRLKNIADYLKEIKNLSVVISSETYSVGKADKKWFTKRTAKIKQVLSKSGLVNKRIQIIPGLQKASKQQLPLKVFGPDALRYYYYRKGSVRLGPKDKKRLNLLVRYIQDFYTSGQIIISSHTDSKGRRSDNLKVSKRRGEVLKQYLVSQGIEPKRIRVKAYGESRPVKSNRFPPGRAMNRRAVISLID